MKLFIRRLGLKIAQTIGMPLQDFRSGKSLGRVLIIPWRGKIHVIGLDVAVRHVAVRPMFQPQKRLTYWKQEIVFTGHPPPDFSRETIGAADKDAAAQPPAPTP